jgi:chemotaxis protein MotB
VCSSDLNSLIEAFDKSQVGKYTGNSIMVVNSGNVDTFLENNGDLGFGYSVTGEAMRDIANDILSVMDSLVKSGQVTVKITREGVSVDINAGVLFKTGDAVIENEYKDTMIAVARKLKKISNLINIEGHTDDYPINTPLYPSNWELSSARASSVVRLFIEQGVSPSRLKVVGFADQKPLESNLSEKGRSRNRRVSVIIESGTDGEL